MDNEHIQKEKAYLISCPMQSKNCKGENCAAWRWTGYKIKRETVIVKLLDNGRMKEGEKVTETNTHGCCGMVYRNVILKEI